MSKRLLGSILFTLGFTIALVAGLVIATQVSGGAAVGTLLGAAGLVFMLVAGLVGAGLYLYVQSEREAAAVEEAEPESATRQQRALMDLLRERPRMRVSDLARELGVLPEQVRVLIADLGALDLFTGAADWRGDMLYFVPADSLRGQTTCAVCGAPIRLASEKRLTHVIPCASCGTEYFVAGG